MAEQPFNPLDGGPQWFAEELARSEAAIAALKRAMPPALKAAQEGSLPVSVELYDPIRHHGLEQREIIQVQAGSTLGRALWPGLFLGSMLSALGGWAIWTRLGRPQFLWQPLIAQLLAILCGQLWAMQIRERIPVEALGLSAAPREASDIRVWLHASSDLWRFIRASMDEPPVAERILYHGGPLLALLGSAAWASNLLRPGAMSGPGFSQIGFLIVEVGLLFWLGFLLIAVRMLELTEHSFSSTDATTLRGRSRRVSLASVLWLTSGALLCIALLGYASREASAPKPRALPTVPPTVTPPSDPTIVVGVNDFGGAYPLLLANDGALPGPRSLFKKSGLNVEVRWVQGSKDRIRDFDRGEIHLMLLTLDYLAQLAPAYRRQGNEVQALVLIDWSRGNAGIVAKSKYLKVEDLVDVHIGTSQYTPTHYLLLYALQNSSLTPEALRQIQIDFVSKTPLANQSFYDNKIQALVTWEPYLSQAVDQGDGRVLFSTETATHLLADVLFARRKWLQQNQEQLVDFLRAYFQGLKQMQAEPERMMALAGRPPFKHEEAKARSILKKVKWANFADNREFFHLEFPTPRPGAKIPAYDDLFRIASRIWFSLKVITEETEPAEAKWSFALERLLREKNFADEKLSESFTYDASKLDRAQPLLTKPLSIYFARGSSDLKPEAQETVDQVVTILQTIQGAYVRVEGNTDDLGRPRDNLELSKKRAQAVVDYLVTRHRLDRERFSVVGNGSDKLIGDKTTQGREKNRRTDFVILKAESSAVSVPAKPAAK